MMKDEAVTHALHLSSCALPLRFASHILMSLHLFPQWASNFSTMSWHVQLDTVISSSFLLYVLLFSRVFSCLFFFFCFSFPLSSPPTLVPCSHFLLLFLLAALILALLLHLLFILIRKMQSCRFRFSSN